MKHSRIIVLSLVCLLATGTFARNVKEERQRRSLDDDKDDEGFEGGPFDETAFNSMIAGMQSQITAVINSKLEELIPKAVEKYLQSMQDGNMGPPGAPGLPGPPGPRGPKGEKGPSISKPILADKNLDKTSMSVDELTLECRFTGIPAPTVEWKTNALNYTQKDYDLGGGEIRSFLTVYVSSYSDRGPVSCKASNLLGETEATGELTVLVAPSIKAPYKTHTAVLGFDTVFPAMEIVANPEARTTWTIRSGALPSERFVQEDGQLTIKNVQQEDEGTYVFTAKNSIGEVSVEVDVKVVSFGFGTKMPATLLVKKLPAELTCEVFGDTSMFTAKWVGLTCDKPDLDALEIKTPASITLKVNATELGHYYCQVTGMPHDLRAYTEVKFIEKYDGYSEWSEFTGCTKCDGIEQSTRTRTCETPDPDGTGTTCKVLGEVDTDTVDCEQTKCHGCVYQSGDGGDGGEEKIGTFENEADCAAKCMERRKINPNINGASVDVSTGKDCWCEENMTNSDGSDSYKSCIFPNIAYPTTTPYPDFTSTSSY